MKQKLRKYAALTAALLCLSACEGVKQDLGYNPKGPDEFAVVNRAPLAMPPDYTLRPPQPGAPRPQEIHPDSQAQEAVFGGKTQATATTTATGASAESALLQQTGAADASPNIRATVDKEAAQAKQDKDKPVSEKLLGWTGLTGGDSAQPDSGTVVNAPAEAARIQQNQQQGKPVTTGDTPSQDQDQDQ